MFLLNYLGLLSIFFIKYFWMVFCGMEKFCFSRSHILLALLSLEAVNLALLVLISLYFSFSFSEFYFYLMFLVLMICEGVLGLCMVVSLMRVEGNDYVYGLVMLC